MRTKTRLLASTCLLLGGLTALASWPHLGRHKPVQQDWPVYGGNAMQQRFSPLTQINRSNVEKLKVAWTYKVGDRGGVQTNPLVIGHTLYGFTPTQKAFALDAATGRQLWIFDPGTHSEQPARGFTYWTDGSSSILFAGGLNFLYALDPATGKPIPTFGEQGHLDLRKDLDRSESDFAAMTSPGVIYKNLLIIGFRLPEVKPALHGDIRAYDVHTGKLRWIFHTIPHPGEPGYETWPKDAWKTTGSANNWTGMSIDAERGIVYVPTGSAVDDFYGADRLGDDLWANCLLALDAETGKLIWHFQGVHHDIWDRDFPSPPTLLTVNSNGRKVDAVAQTSKQGYVYVFDRATGKSLFPITERPFPGSTVPGEKTAPTQPLPVAPKPFARQRVSADMLTTRTPEAHDFAARQFASFVSDGQFIPLSVDKSTIVFPGFDGGAEWGGSAADPRTGVLYVNANDVPWTGSLTENKPMGSLGGDVYMSQCSTCHAPDREGSPPAFPSLVDIHKRLSDAQITAVIQAGRGRMPSFPNVQQARLTSLLEYLRTGKDTPTSARTGLSPNRQEVAGAKVYDRNCAICHGEDLLGAPSNYPGLVGVRGRLTDAQILANIHNGKGRMPAFRKLSATDNTALLQFLGASQAPMLEAAVAGGQLAAAGDKKEVASALAPAGGASKYRFTGYHKFLDNEGYPAVVPPWGTLNAIDLNTGKYLWKVPLGNYPELAAKGLADTGSENYGGPVVTAGGVLFIGATIYDQKLRAFDTRNGHLLWSADLPFAGVATPATYMVDGKQYVVIATSNQRNPKAPQGAAYVAFALP